MPIRSMGSSTSATACIALATSLLSSRIRLSDIHNRLALESSVGRHLASYNAKSISLRASASCEGAVSRNARLIDSDVKPSALGPQSLTKLDMQKASSRPSVCRAALYSRYDQSCAFCSGSDDAREANS